MKKFFLSALMIFAFAFFALLFAAIWLASGYFDLIWKLLLSDVLLIFIFAILSSITFERRKIKPNDLISEEAIEAPKKMAHHLEKVVEQLEILKKEGLI